MNLIERRRQMMMSKSLPYDAEIEYLESSGTQYIDTGISANAERYDLQLEFAISRNKSSHMGIFSLYDGGRIYLLEKSPSDYISGKNDGTYYLDRNAHVSYNSLNSFARIDLTITNSSAYLKVGNNTNTCNVSTSRKSSQSFYFFDRHDVNNSSPTRPVYGRCKYLKLWKDEELVLDFIPVRVGQVGYMYDRVSGQLFGNQGTGNFVLGEDKN